MNLSMKTNKIKKETKTLKNPKLAEEALVMHTSGAEMPNTRKGHNLELKNAKSVFSDKKQAKTKSNKH
jgi:hypothetical protein